MRSILVITYIHWNSVKKKIRVDYWSKRLDAQWNSIDSYFYGIKSKHPENLNDLSNPEKLSSITWNVSCNVDVNDKDEIGLMDYLHSSSGLAFLAINLNCISVFNSRGEGWIDAGVGAWVAWDECVTTIDDTFTGDGEIAQSVDIVSRTRIVWLLR